MPFCLIFLSKHSLPGYAVFFGPQKLLGVGWSSLAGFWWELELPDCISTRSWPPAGLKCSILMFPFSCPPTHSSLLLFRVANSCPAPCKFHLAHRRHSDTYSMYIKLIQIKYQNTGNYIPATIPSKHTPLSCHWLIWILFPGNEEDFPRLKMDFLKENKKGKQLYTTTKKWKKKRNFNVLN